MFFIAPFVKLASVHSAHTRTDTWTHKFRFAGFSFVSGEKAGSKRANTEPHTKAPKQRNEFGEHPSPANLQASLQRVSEFRLILQSEDRAERRVLARIKASHFFIQPQDLEA